MARVTLTPTPVATGVATTRQTENVQANTSLRFDLAVTVLSGWLIGGVFLDGWAHNHIPQLETFFTPWHAALYSGFAAVALFLFVSWLGGRRSGASATMALPTGYGWSLAGAGIFLLAGIGDMIWHLIFGIERSVDALYSPTHLGLAFGGILIVSGPLRAWWRDTSHQRLRGYLAMFSLCYLLSAFGFFTQVMHPFVYPFAGNNLAYDGTPWLVASLGVASVMLQAAFVAGLVLLVLRMRAIPPGGLTLVLTLNALLLSFMQDQYRFIFTAALAGIAGDLLLAGLRPSVTRPLAFRLFAFAFPAIVYLVYFMTVQLTEGIWWTVHLWLGSMVIAGIIGLGLSYLLLLPQYSAPERQ